MSLSDAVKRFYQGNLAGGEWRQHRGAYLAFALAGYLLHMTCCSPAKGAEPPAYQLSRLERIVGK